MKDQFDALCPIFYESEKSSFNHIGTGVVINFRDTIFILTAGHVIDELNKEDDSALMIPTSDNSIVSIEGTYSYFTPTNDRPSDMMDFGYFKLDLNFANEIKKVFPPIEEADLHITDFIPSSKLFSFSGYPHRKSKIRGKNTTTEMFSYGTYIASPDEYENLGCNPIHHIVAKFDRKNSINPILGEKQTPPLPHGISGGGVYMWPKNSHDIPPKNRKLIGIGHTYKKNEGYFIGTNLKVILASILYNNPHLR